MYYIPALENPGFIMLGISDFEIWAIQLVALSVLALVPLLFFIIFMLNRKNTEADSSSRRPALVLLTSQFALILITVVMLWNGLMEEGTMLRLGAVNLILAFLVFTVLLQLMLGYSMRGYGDSFLVSFSSSQLAALVYGLHGISSSMDIRYHPVAIDWVSNNETIITVLLLSVMGVLLLTCAISGIWLAFFKSR